MIDFWLKLVQISFLLFGQSIDLTSQESQFPAGHILIDFPGNRDQFFLQFPGAPGQKAIKSDIENKRKSKAEHIAQTKNVMITDMERIIKKLPAEPKDLVENLKKAVSEIKVKSILVGL